MTADTKSGLYLYSLSTDDSHRQQIIPLLRRMIPESIMWLWRTNSTQKIVHACSIKQSEPARHYSVEPLALVSHAWFLHWNHGFGLSFHRQLKVGQMISGSLAVHISPEYWIIRSHKHKNIVHMEFHSIRCLTGTWSQAITYNSGLWLIIPPLWMSINNDSHTKKCRNI